MDLYDLPVLYKVTYSINKDLRMLKGIPKLITPQMLYTLSAMGHGDSVVLADANFPAYRIASGHTLVHLPDTSICELLRALLTVFPLDHLHEHSGYVMEVDSEDQKRGVKTPLWQEYSEILGTENNNSRQLLGSYSRAAFYEESLKAQLIVLTGECAPYANLMLYKGVLN